MKKCKLCEEKEASGKHHIVPKCVINRINPKSKLKDKTVPLCDYCHREIHYAYLIHLIMMGKIDGYDRKDAIKYKKLEKFIKKNKPKIFKEFEVQWKEFIHKTMEEFGKEELGKIK